MIVLNSPSARWSALTLAVTCAALSAGCGGGAREQTANPTPVEQRRAVVEKEGVTSSPQRAPGTEAPAEQSTGEVPPQILALFQEDAARRALVKPETITVVSATEQQWSDGAMGCPQPGQMYTQALIAGYRVVLQAGAEKYAYHSDQRGRFIVCASGLAFAPVKEQMKQPTPSE